jgi:predicted nucleic acid-binding protein
VLVDTSVLGRLANPDDPATTLALSAVQRLKGSGRALYIVPQNLFELWVVCSRPKAQNGLGYSPTTTAAELARMKRLFTFLPDNEKIYDICEDLVTTYQVSGKPAHDARLVAAAMAHGLREILTFDKAGFARFPTLAALHPSEA